jgi:hypothetical protein
MIGPVTSLASRYASITNGVGRLTAQHAGNGDKAAMSRLVLRAAILNARLHNTDDVVTTVLRSTALELEG